MQKILKGRNIIISDTIYPIYRASRTISAFLHHKQRIITAKDIIIWLKMVLSSWLQASLILLADEPAGVPTPVQRKMENI